MTRRKFLRPAYYIVVFLILFTATLTTIIVAGVIQVRYVATGSMEPNIPRHSLVVLYMVPKEIKIGDVVAYYYPEAPKELLLHRVIAKTDSQLIVKGDAVPYPEKIDYSQLKGKFLFGVPEIGKIKTWDPLTLYVVIIGIAAILLLFK